ILSQVLAMVSMLNKPAAPPAGTAGLSVRGSNPPACSRRLFSKIQHVACMDRLHWQEEMV
ncbi:MAG: hypothetical protein FWF31_12875, partial [Desulfobulbus sp.]|nr:hypothetical protein [Desulfobulbus sp.]